jgi:multidrug efflux pump subunit AcrB
LIVTVSIPLSILGAVVTLSAFGETLNIMTLGGPRRGRHPRRRGDRDDREHQLPPRARQAGRDRNHGRRFADRRAGVRSLLCICIVFILMFFLDGVARFLFVPMAEAVMFAMVFSFILSRTLVPTMAKYLLKPHAAHVDAHGNVIDAPVSGGPLAGGPLVRFQRGFEARFIRMRAGYRDLLELAIDHRRVFVSAFLLFVAASFLLTPMLGRNFFPAVDGGQILMHVRAPIGTRVEETAARFADVQKAIREIIPANELRAIVDNVGTYLSSINTIYNNTGSIGSQDGDIQISLGEGHRPTDEYVQRLREELPRRFPGLTFSFLPADIVSQILNFGAPAPIDLQVRGNNLAANFAYAGQLLGQIRPSPAWPMRISSNRRPPRS